MSDTNVGGLSENKMADAHIQKIGDEMKPAVDKKVGQDFKEFTAIRYREQVVAGMNYFIKVNVGDNTCAHIRVYEKLPCHGGGYELCGVQYPKTPEDPIEYF